MSAYRYIQAPATSSVRGATGTGLIQLPSQGSYSGVTMAAPLTGAIGGTAARGLGLAFLSDFLANMLSGAVQSGTAAATGALTPSSTDVSSGGKYMVTLSDLRDYEQFLFNENFRRGLMGLEPIDVKKAVKEREAELRRSAAEAGAREYALEQVKQQGAIQSALAGTLGTGLTSTGGVAQAGINTAGDVTRQAIASALARPNIDPMNAELARAF